jgi:hypothetical protein
MSMFLHFMSILFKLARSCLQGNGQAVVFNNNVVTANPTSMAAANPKTLMQAAANAFSKVKKIRCSGNWLYP